MKKICETCNWFQVLRTANLDRSEKGICRRDPPTVALITSYQTTETAPQNGTPLRVPSTVTRNVYRGLWPSVNQDDWCGEWEAPPPKRGKTQKTAGSDDGDE